MSTPDTFNQEEFRVNLNNKFGLHTYFVAMKIYFAIDHKTDLDLIKIAGKYIFCGECIFLSINKSAYYGYYRYTSSKHRLDGKRSSIRTKMLDLIKGRWVIAIGAC